MPFPHLLPDSRHNAVQSLATEPCYQGVCSAVQCVQERENLQTLCYIKEATRKTHTKENQISDKRVAKAIRKDYNLHVFINT